MNKNQDDMFLDQRVSSDLCFPEIHGDNFKKTFSLVAHFTKTKPTIEVSPSFCKDVFI